MKAKALLCLFLAMLLWTACEKKEWSDLPDIPRRTVLVYLAGDNSLSTFAPDNIEMIKEGLERDGLANGNLLVFEDTKEGLPRLFQLSVENGVARETVIETYGTDLNTASTETLVQTLDKVMREYPAESYGLVLWSHGTAWLPSDLSSYLRSFGQDGNDEMEINDLAAALSGYHFDFILFDACYMASVEVAYAFRTCADYIIASPTEVLANGFPYRDIMGCMFADEVDAIGMAQAFYDCYSDFYPPCGTVSVVRCDALDALAEACRTILGDKSEEELFAVPVDELQVLERLTRRYHALYDLEDYVSRLADTDEERAAFRRALDDAVPYKAATPTSYYALGGAFPIERFSGLSVYVPQAVLSELNAWYKSLEWYLVVYGA